MDSFVLEYRDYFQTRIRQYEASHPSHTLDLPTGTPDTTVCARIRPLTAQKLADKNQKSSFNLDEVYGPETSTKGIYDSPGGVSELADYALAGKTGMLLAYGQTGSGKTFTVVGLEELLVEKLMSAKDREVHVCIFEVAGKNLYDLLNNRNPITTMEDLFGTVQLIGVHEKNPKTATEFLGFIEEAKSHRSTASTSKNDTSSRSHSICRIRILNPASPTATEGSLLLVDLAGSEASSDTTHHTKERMLETVEINKSLSVLKECITKRAAFTIARSEGAQKHVHIPFRSSKLTQVLKSAFDVQSSQSSKTIIIACIAPSILDVAHSKNTFRYAETLRIPVPKAKPLPFDERIPTTWSNADVHAWIRKYASPSPSFCFFGKAMLTHE
ncbi:Diatom spindle kinesin-1 [Lachnellula suecica]|uniref:Kinesin-like protein n=1 Tax=Lachnellula suecica TaxID=602035 RepID=A0A8T9BXH1_9HELO|nr:Diatom spindle kinesin-1 [Lachnellula suecica]